MLVSLYREECYYVGSNSEKFTGIVSKRSRLTFEKRMARLEEQEDLDKRDAEQMYPLLGESRMKPYYFDIRVHQSGGEVRQFFFSQRITGFFKLLEAKSLNRFASEMDRYLVRLFGVIKT